MTYAAQERIKFRNTARVRASTQTQYTYYMGRNAVAFGENAFEAKWQTSHDQVR